MVLFPLKRINGYRLSEKKSFVDAAPALRLGYCVLGVLGPKCNFVRMLSQYYAYRSLFIE